MLGTAAPAVSLAASRRLQAFLAERTRELTELDAAAARLGTELQRLAGAGGKHLRPAFVAAGAHAAAASSGEGVPEDAVATVGAAVELTHLFALVHDDVMDGSPRRRGVPSVHASLAASRGEHAHVRDDAAWFGASGAILVGDLAMTWADDLLEDVDLPPARRLALLRAMRRLRAEVIAGQYLEVRGSGGVVDRPEEALRIAVLKSGRYTVTRPLQLGAAVVADDGPWCGVLARFGDAAGLAFQLRDDVLGLFGGPGRTGKGVLEDLRQGRPTALFVLARARARDDARRRLQQLLATPEAGEAALTAVRDLVVTSGALAEVHAQIERCTDRARRAVEDLPPAAREPLLDLLRLVVDRDR
ncbi:polyprenyl synthetase family protein [Egicoccus sp. AB-alg2]|uniref:polyprenyl synthetase family protein n=1 Tax=Egicoccus sp. AB-alg2 TaxID=3242693 RepID=UPI00359DDC7B